jgi:hypothetical protein
LRDKLCADAQILFSKYRYISRMKIAAAALLLAASLAVPATACADDAPSVDQIIGIMAELTDPNRPAASKGDVVTPGFSPEDAGAIDDHLHHMDAVGLLPLPFVVTDIQPAPNHFAGATLATTGSLRQSSKARPIVLVEQNGRWLLTHDSAMNEMNAFWFNASRGPYDYIPPPPVDCQPDSTDPTCQPPPPPHRQRVSPGLL